MEDNLTPTEILVKINKKKKEHESIKSEMLEILDRIDILKSEYNNLLIKLENVESEYILGMTKLIDNGTQ